MSTFPFVLLRKGTPFLLHQPREIEVLLPRPFPQVVLPRWRSRTQPHTHVAVAHTLASLSATGKGKEKREEERRREQLKFPLRPFSEIGESAAVAFVRLPDLDSHNHYANNNGDSGNNIPTRHVCHAIQPYRCSGAGGQRQAGGQARRRDSNRGACSGRQRLW